MENKHLNKAYSKVERRKNSFCISRVMLRIKGNFIIKTLDIKLKFSELKQS